MGDDVTTRLQNDITHNQQEIGQIQTELQQLDKKMKVRLDGFHFEMKQELKKLFELMMAREGARGEPTAVAASLSRSVTGLSANHTAPSDKGLFEVPIGLPPRRA